jgi:hypothetical protein
VDGRQVDAKPADGERDLHCGLVGHLLCAAFDDASQYKSGGTRL